VTLAIGEIGERDPENVQGFLTRKGNFSPLCRTIPREHPQQALDDQTPVAEDLGSSGIAGLA